MACGGFRTLLMAQRELDAKFYESWEAEYDAASVALDDREGKIAAVSEKIEQDLELLGATAVEDKLQVGYQRGQAICCSLLSVALNALCWCCVASLVCYLQSVHSLLAAGYMNRRLCKSKRSYCTCMQANSQ